MIPFSEAVQVAQQTLQQLVPNVSNVLLKEVELKNGKEWNITLSFPDGNAVVISGLLNTPRKYKLFVIDAETGEFKAMKIRNA